MSHTPAPWTIHPLYPFKVVCGDERSFICVATTKEDARLIAAAPALADALVRIERGCVSVLLDAALSEQPINPEVLEQIIKDIGAALAQAKDTSAELGRNGT